VILDLAVGLEHIILGGSAEDVDQPAEVVGGGGASGSVHALVGGVDGSQDVVEVAGSWADVRRVEYDAALFVDIG